MASALGTIAGRIADSDPARAAALARTIMSLRDADALSPVLAKLRKSRPELAKSMMAEAVQSASITLDSYFLASIARQLMIARQKRETAYPQLDEPLLAAMNDALLQTPANKFEQEESCKLTRVARQFIKAIGAETPASVDEAWERCSAVRMLEDPPPEIKGIRSPTFDDYLAASRIALEARDRAAFRMQAALIIARTDAPRSLDIAAGLTTEEKKSYPGWRKITLTIAKSAVLLRHKADDSGGVQQVLDTVTAALRPVVGVEVATGARKQPDERTFAIEMLKFARRALDKDSVDDSEMLVGLINGYAAVIPTEAPVAMDDATRMLNNIPHPPSFWRDPAEVLADIARNGMQSTLPVPPLGFELRPAKIDEEVVDITTTRWDGALRGVRDKADRLALRLGLIHRLLEMAAAL